jgi:hypothetical protein
MQTAPHRISLVLEHISATDRLSDDADEDSWFVVAYEILDSGKRKRATLRQCHTREHATDVLGALWQEITNPKIA